MCKASVIDQNLPVLSYVTGQPDPLYSSYTGFFLFWNLSSSSTTLPHFFIGFLLLLTYASWTKGSAWSKEPRWWMPKLLGSLRSQFLDPTSWKQYLMWEIPPHKEECWEDAGCPKVWEQSTLHGLCQCFPNLNMRSDHLRILLKQRFSLRGPEGKREKILQFQQVARCFPCC